MGHVAITLNRRTYRLRCGNGEEPHVIALAEAVRQRVQTLIAEFGQVGDDRLLLIAALLIADDLAQARARLAQLEQQLYDPSSAGPEGLRSRIG